MSDPELDFARAVAETLNRIGRVLESLALQADRYDAELDLLRAENRALSNRIEAVARMVCGEGNAHSMRVVP